MNWRTIPKARSGSDGTAVPGYRRVLLVNPPMAAIGAEFMMEDIPLRLEYLAAHIRSHVDEVEVLDLANGTGRLESALKKLKPDLVGISINYISTHRNGVELARVARRSGAVVVVGGYQATAMVDELAADPDIDFVVRGEGEATLLELVQRGAIEEIKGISYCRGGVVTHNEDRPLIADLDSLPFPERTRRRRRYRLPFADLDSDVSTAYEMIITSRGCWGKCTFCTEPLMSNGMQRYRKPEKIVEELEQIVKLHPGKRLRVHIADPNFGGKPRLAEELCDHLIEFRARCHADLHFFVSVRTSTIANNHSLARKMIQAGVDYVFVGMESPKASDLKCVAKGGDSQARQERATKYLQDGGAEVMSNFLLGLPGQTEEDIMGLVAYAKRLGLADCYFSVMTPLPGSKLYEQAVENDLLLENDCTKFRLYDFVMKHDTLSRAKIRELCVRANAKWYDDLMLRQEHRRYLAKKGKKRRLYDFAGKFGVLVNFFAFIGSGADTEFSELDPALFVRDMPSPGLRKFTAEAGVHRFLEMRRFLRVLGAQTIHVTLRVGSEDVVTWVAKTTATTVEYLDAIHGAPAGRPTIAIRLCLDKGALTPARVLARILGDNRGLRSRINLARLAAATSSELLASWVDRAAEAVRSKAYEAAAGVESWLAKLPRQVGSPRPSGTAERRGPDRASAGGDHLGYGYAFGAAMGRSRDAGNANLVCD